MNASQTCTRCFLPSDFPKAEFDDQGVCNHCRALSSPEHRQKLQADFSVDRLDELRVLARQIKAQAAKDGSSYDCICGASGGFDSTYVVYVAKQLMGLNPLVIKYDNGFCHKLSDQNLREACNILDVDLRIISRYPHERGYLANSVKALRNLGVFFTACFSCHYILPSLVYKTAAEENITYMLTSRNEIEDVLDASSNSFMVKSLIEGFLKCGPLKMLKFFYYELLAQISFARLKLQIEGLSLRFLRHLATPYPSKPARIKTLNVTDYVGWDYLSIEKTLRDELNFDTPLRMKVPVFRWDCLFSALTDQSYKKVVGITGHALLSNWFVQAGLASKEDLEEGMAYLNDDERIEREVKEVFEELGL